MLNEKLSALASGVSEAEKKQLFFLGGVIKSGTTWIERIYDHHPEAVCKGESHFGQFVEPALAETLAGYNQAIVRKGNWRRHQASGLERSPNTEFSYLTHDLDYLVRYAILVMLQKWAGESNIKAIGEKTPGNSAYFPKLHYLFPNARFVYIVRDVRDVIVSGWYFGLSVNANDVIDKHQSIEKYAGVLASAWDREVRQGLAFIHEAGDQGMFIRYEDLLADATAEIRNLFEFMGLDASDEIVRQVRSHTSFKTLSGGRSRGDENRKSFFRKGVSGDWVHHLDDATVSSVMAQCGELLGLLGYDN